MSLLAREAIKTEESTYTPADEAVSGPIVPFGIYHLDESLPAGIKPTSPQLIAIQGGSGSRKTTLILNLINNMCLSGTLPSYHRIIVDTLENGMTVERYFLAMRQMIATKILIYEYWLKKCLPVDVSLKEYLWWLFNQELPPLGARELAQGPKDTIHGKEMSICVLTADFIEACYREVLQMTDRQLYAWQLAGQAIADFPVEVFGVSEHPDPDEAGRRSCDTTSIAISLERWLKLNEEYGSIQVISDHLGEYWIGEGTTAHDRQIRIVPYYSRFVKTARTTLWAINQEGIGHQREFQYKGKVLGSMGGDILGAAAQLNWRVGYEKHIDMYHMKLFMPVKSRRGNHPDLLLNIEPNSGAIFGKSQVIERE
jgi:hypothetical protein